MPRLKKKKKKQGICSEKGITVSLKLFLFLVYLIKTKRD